MTNKVYSPQYVLWLLPFVVLARPRWRDWLVFTVGELVYFVAIWWHLGGLLSPGDGSADRVYWLAVLARLATQAWVVGDRRPRRPAARARSRPPRRRSTTRPVASSTVPRTPPGSPGSGAPSGDGVMRLTALAPPRPGPSSATGGREAGGGGRLVVQAWLASRGLIALVALLLALREGRSFTDMVSNWDVQHFSRAGARAATSPSPTAC